RNALIQDLIDFVLRYQILERVNCIAWISGLYTSRLLDAACKKVLNLLKKDCWFRGKLRQHQYRHHQLHKLKLHMYLNLFHTQSLKQRLSLHGKKVKAIPKSAWTEKRSDWQLPERKKVNEELRKVCW
nr:hypothetical protein [Tanacetum cinerariifolium]